MQLTPAGLAAIIREEGFKPSWYTCPAGKKTIGVGHVILPTEKQYLAKGFKLTQLQGMELLQKDISERFGPQVERLCRRKPTANQMAALVSFAFNVGAGGLAQSHLLQLHNTGTATAEEITEAFGRWNKIRNPETQILEVSAGLTKRRAREAALYLTA
jgi:lysozyme